MAFKIRFLETQVPKERLTGSGEAIYGEIRIGDHRERLVIPTGYWTVGQYIEQWSEALQIILSGKEQPRTALITEMYDTRVVNFAMMWWPMYKDGDVVRIQNGYISLQEQGITQISDRTSIYDLIPDQSNEADTWTVTMHEISAFALYLKDEFGEMHTYRSLSSELKILTKDLITSAEKYVHDRSAGDAMGQRILSIIDHSSYEASPANFKLCIEELDEWDIGDGITDEAVAGVIRRLRDLCANN